MTCPNYSTCQLIHIKGFIQDNEKLKVYLMNYCLSDNEKWHHCKRFITNRQLNFCPDFVFPDTELTVDEIIDRFDE